MTTTTFPKITGTKQTRRVQCPACGKTRTATWTPSATQNPYNLDPDTGLPRTEKQIRAKLAADGAAWKPTVVESFHDKCWRGLSRDTQDKVRLATAATVAGGVVTEPTDEQVAAAKLRIALDAKLDRETPEIVQGIASAQNVHRVAVTVFALVEGADARDASHVAEIALRQNLSGCAAGPPEPLPVAIHARLARGRVPVTVVQVMETGMAAGNGYLWTGPTLKAFREGE